MGLPSSINHKGVDQLNGLYCGLRMMENICEHNTIDGVNNITILGYII